MMKVTLDTNCLYELEKPSVSPALRSVIERSRAGQLALRVPAIAASERQAGGGHLNNFGKFQDRLAALGIGHAELLRPLAYLGVVYIGHCLLSGPELEAEERQIHEILFPKIAFRAIDHCPETDVLGRKKWRNAKCDVQAMWCHIHYGGDIFVTRDRDFLKESSRSRLESVGARKIAVPEEAIEVIDTKLVTERPV